MESFLKILGVLGLIAILSFIMAFPTKWLWNWLMTDLFDLARIDFWQALGINIFTGLLFRQTSATKSE